MWKKNILKNQYIADEHMKQSKSVKIKIGSKRCVPLELNILTLNKMPSFLHWKNLLQHLFLRESFITKAAFHGYCFLKNYGVCRHNKWKN